jgi:DNA invertase Pin-like site-specific DNA recombinase
MAGKRASHQPKSRRVLGHPSGRLRKLFRVGLYARVSTHDQQTIPLQTRAMREYAARRSSDGRPATAAVHADQVWKLYRVGTSKSEIARRLTIARTSVRRILAIKPKEKAD